MILCQKVYQTFSGFIVYINLYNYLFLYFSWNVFIYLLFFYLIVLWNDMYYCLTLEFFIKLKKFPTEENIYIYIHKKIYNQDPKLWLC